MEHTNVGIFFNKETSNDIATPLWNVAAQRLVDTLTSSEEYRKIYQSIKKIIDQNKGEEASYEIPLDQSDLTIITDTDDLSFAVSINKTSSFFEAAFLLRNKDRLEVSIKLVIDVSKVGNDTIAISDGSSDLLGFVYAHEVHVPNMEILHSKKHLKAFLVVKIPKITGGTTTVYFDEFPEKIRETKTIIVTKTLV